MKRISIGVLVLLLMVGSYIVGRRRTGHGPAVLSRDSQRVLYWVDPMHPDYKSDHPGVAPDCGMELEPVYEEAVAASGGSAAPMAPEARVVSPMVV